MIKGVYVAGRVRRTNQVAKIAALLEKNDYEITYKWFDEPGGEPKTYRDKQLVEHFDSIIKKALKGSADAEVFILLSEPGMRGTYVEMGAFLYSAYFLKKPNPRVYVIGGDKENHIFESNQFTRFITEAELKEIIKSKRL